MAVEIIQAFWNNGFAAFQKWKLFSSALGSNLSQSLLNNKWSVITDH